MIIREKSFSELMYEHRVTICIMLLNNKIKTQNIIRKY